MSTLPQWLLDKVAGYPGGRMLPKRKHFEPPKPIYSYDQRFLPAYYRGAPEPTAPVDNDLCRFWKIEIFHWEKKECKTYECRNCGTYAYSPEECKEHISKSGCAKQLVKAYKLLLRDHKCVMCDVLTTHERWGVPVCRGSCERHWQEDEATPTALHEALGIARRG